MTTCRNCPSCQEQTLSYNKETGVRQSFYVCVGVKEPFRIYNIDEPCQVHPQKRYTYQFTTSSTWKPMEPGCWSECPVSFFTKLGETCRCVKGEYKCPFLDERYTFE